MAADSSDKRNDSDSSVDSLGKHLEKVRETNTEKAKIIEDSNDALDKNTNEFVDELKSAEKETDSDIGKINSKITTLKIGVDKFFKDSEKEIALITSALERTSSSLRRWSLVLLGIFTALFFATYFLISYFLSPVVVNNIKVDPIFITGIITIGGIFIIIIKTFSSTKSELDKLKDKTPTELTELHETILPITKEKISLESRFSHTNNKLENLRLNLKKVIAYTKAYVPGLQEYYSGIETKNKQEYFALSMRNALQEYGLLDSQIQNMLSGFSSMKNTEEEWLDDTAKNIEEDSSIDAYIIKLCYFDHVNNQGNLKDIWRIIVETGRIENLIDILVRKTNPNGLNAETKGAFTEIISGLEPFTLSDFLNMYNKFYIEFEKEKKIFVQTISGIGLKFNDIRKSEILGIFPNSIKHAQWFTELIEKSAQILSINTDALSLLYSDYVGDIETKTSAWNKIKTDPVLLPLFITKIIQNKIISVPEIYSEDTLSNFYHEVMSNMPQFNLSRLQRNISYEIQNIERIRKTFSFALESKRIFIPEKIRTEHDQLLITSNNIEERVSQFLGKKLDINDNIILLFYCDYNQNTSERKIIFKKIKDDNLSKDLSKIMLENAIVETSSKSISDAEILNLSKVMLVLNDFSIVVIRKYYQSYKNALRDSENIINFLVEMELASYAKINEKTLLELVAKSVESTKFEYIKNLTEIIYEQCKKNDFGLDNESIVISALVLFFAKYNDTTISEACKKAALIDMASKILYAWIDTKELERLGKGSTVLYQIIKDVFERKFSQFDAIEEFKAELSKGTFRGTLSNLMIVKFNTFGQEIEEKISKNDKYVAILNRVTTSIRNFMETEIKNEFIVQVLNSQLISAYMITSVEGAIITIVDKYLSDACKQLSSQDPRYKNLLMLTDTATAGGKWTRIGLVPLTVKDFEEFNNLFSRAFDAALDLYIKDVQGARKQDFSAHLIRIIPSNLAFKLIQSEGINKITKEHPVDAIAKLISSRLGSVDKIKLASLAEKTVEPTVALGNVISNLFNNFTSIYNMTDDMIHDIVSTQKKLLEIMDDKKLDQELEMIYGVSTLTDLSIILHRMQVKSKEEAENVFTNHVTSTLNKYNIKIDEQQTKRLSVSMLERITDLGSVLDMKPMLA